METINEWKKEKMSLFTPSGVRIHEGPMTRKTELSARMKSYEYIFAVLGKAVRMRMK